MKHPRTVPRAEFAKDPGEVFRRAEREGYIAVVKPDGTVHAIVSSPTVQSDPVVGQVWYGISNPNDRVTIFDVGHGTVGYEYKKKPGRIAVHVMSVEMFLAHFELRSDTEEP